MKKVLASLLILLQLIFIFPMQSLAFDEQTTVIVHYQEAEGNEKDWNLWIWPAGGEGSVYDFTGEDNFGKIATITLPGNHDNVGFIVRTESWEKDTSNDRFIEQFNNGVGEIWLIGGQEAVYYENPEGPDVILDEQVTLDINYHNYDENYANISAIVYADDSNKQTISLEKITDFGVSAEILLTDTLNQEKIIVEILTDDHLIGSFDVKKIKDGKADIYLVENNERVFYTPSDAVYKPKAVTAKLSDTQTILLETNMPFKATEETMSVMVNGKSAPIDSLSFEMVNNDFNGQSGIVKLSDKVSYTDDIVIIIPKFDEINVQLGDVYDTEEFRTHYTYNGSDLGPTYLSNSTTFKVWAPTAQDINLVLFDDYSSEVSERYDMIFDQTGVWTATVSGDLHNQLYAYEVKHQSDYEFVVDPYAKGVSVNGVRSAVIDLERTNPKLWDVDYKTNFTSITDAIMYEVHVRDLSMHSQSGIKNKGLFLGFAETGTTTNDGYSTGLDYIKELGVTHIQFMPIYDYGSVDESKDDYQYNWGYDPVNYNALEGSYASDPFAPDVRINEFKQAVQAIHDEGMKVTMDVVYNHVFSLNAMAFEKLVPGYYFRKEETGNYANGSGCGNETASERPMVRKFIVDSVTYLANEYNLDGFRFDLMGLHDVDTMNQVRASLNEIDPSITIIGEGWNMGNVLNEDSKANQNQAHLMSGIAHFNDTIRDGLKGSVFDSLDQGFVNGKPGMESVVFSGIVGGIVLDDISTWGDIEPTQSVTYVEAHDNNTLYDKLKLSNPESKPAEIKKMHLLADSIVLTSQGVTFIHAGQEFLRTKLGDENSYKSSDIVNRLDWLRREKNNDTVEYFKGLIKLKKEHKAFRFSTKEEIQNSITPLSLENNVIAYHITSDDVWESIVVIHNANTEAVSVSLPENAVWEVVVKEGQAGIESIESVSGDDVMVSGIDTVVMYKSSDIDTGNTTKDASNMIYVYIGVILLVAAGGVIIIKKRTK